MGGSRPHSELFFCGKPSQNSPKPVLIFWSSIPCVFCLYIHCQNCWFYDLSVLSMSDVSDGFPKKNLGGGWVGGVSAIQFFFDFLKLLQSPLGPWLLVEHTPSITVLQRLLSWAILSICCQPCLICMMPVSMTCRQVIFGCSLFLHPCVFHVAACLHLLYVGAWHYHGVAKAFSWQLNWHQCFIIHSPATTNFVQNI